MALSRATIIVHLGEVVEHQPMQRGGIVKLITRSLLVALLASGVATTGAAAVVVSEYRFEEGLPNTGAASVLDSSGFGNDGVASGSPNFSADVPFGKIPLTGTSNTLSLQFDNTKTASVTFNNSFIFDSPGDATLEFWLKVPDQVHSAIFWGRSDISDTNRFHIFLSGTGSGSPYDGLGINLGMDYRAPDGSLHPLAGYGLPGDVPLLLSANIWTHVGITRSSEIYSFFLNGTLINQTTDILPNLPTTTGWQLAGRSHDFYGLIDEIRMTDAALSPSEFLNANGGPSNLPEPSSIVIWGLLGIGTATLHRWRGRHKKTAISN